VIIPNANSHVFGETPGKAAGLGDIPDVVKAFLDFLHHGYGGPHEECEADAAEDATVHVVDERHDLVGDFHAAVAERFEKQVHLVLDLLVDTEALEHRKTEGQQRHDRQQCRVDETHGPHRQLAAEKVA
jgi:hypothetical protein